MTKQHMTAARLKQEVENRGTSSHFFTRSTMRYFGDTMANYGVKTAPVTVCRYDGTTAECWELFRRKAVQPSGLSSSAFFDINTFERVIPKEGEQ
jgi:hypothetical protein